MSITTTLAAQGAFTPNAAAVLGDRLAAIISLHDDRQHNSTAAPINDVTMLKLEHFFPGRLTGGAYRDRTDDLMLAKHALSQLS